MYQLTSGHPSGKIYQKVTKRNYLAYFDDYMAVKEAHLEWFLPEAARLGGYNVHLLDFTPDSLVTIWEGLISSIHRGEYYDFTGLEKDLPLWVYIVEGLSSEKYGTYSPDSLWLMDGLAYYVGDVYIKNYPNDFEWKPYAPDFYNRVNDGLHPMILCKDNHGYLCNPFDSIRSACVATWSKEGRPKKYDLKNPFDYLVKRYFDAK